MISVRTTFRLCLIDGWRTDADYLKSFNLRSSHLSVSTYASLLLLTSKLKFPVAVAGVK